MKGMSEEFKALPQEERIRQNLEAKAFVANTCRTLLRKKSMYIRNTGLTAYVYMMHSAITI